MNRKPIKDWELEKGVILRKNKNNNKITEKQFQNRIKTEYVKCKTLKGMMCMSEIMR